MNFIIEFLVVTLSLVHKASPICLQKTDVSSGLGPRDIVNDAYIHTVMKYRKGDDLVLHCPARLMERSSSFRWFFTNNKDEVYQIVSNGSCKRPWSLIHKSLYLADLKANLEGYYSCTDYHRLPFYEEIISLHIYSFPMVTLHYKLILSGSQSLNVSLRHLKERLRMQFERPKDSFLLNTIRRNQNRKSYSFVSKLTRHSHVGGSSTFVIDPWNPSFQIDVYDVYVKSPVVFFQMECEHFIKGRFSSSACFQIQITKNTSLVSFRPFQKAVIFDEEEETGSVDKLSIWYVKELRITGDHEILGGVWILDEDIRSFQFSKALKDVPQERISADLKCQITLSNHICSEIMVDHVPGLRSVPLLANLGSSLILSIVVVTHRSSCGRVNLLLVSHQHNVRILYENCRDIVSLFVSRSHTEKLISQHICLHSPLELLLYSIESNIFIYCSNVKLNQVHLRNTSRTMMLQYEFIFSDGCTDCFIVLKEDVTFLKLKILENYKENYSMLEDLKQSQDAKIIRAANLEGPKRRHIEGQINLPGNFHRKGSSLSIDDQVAVTEILANRLLRKDNAEMTITGINKECSEGQELVEVDEHWYCSSCSSGQYFEASSRRCNPCPVGYYQLSIRSSNCSKCTEQDFNDSIGILSMAACRPSRSLKSKSNFYDWFSNIGLSNLTINSSRVTETGYDWKPSVTSICLMFAVVIFVISIFAQCAYYTTTKILMSYVDL